MIAIYCSGHYRLCYNPASEKPFVLIFDGVQCDNGKPFSTIISERKRPCRQQLKYFTDFEKLTIEKIAKTIVTKFAGI